MFFTYLVFASIALSSKPVIDSGECQPSAISSKSFQELRDKNVLAALRYTPGTTRCFVEIDVHLKGLPKSVFHLSSETEQGEIAGVEVAGMSPRQNKFAIDLWLAAGDWTEHRILLVDRDTRKAILGRYGTTLHDRSLQDAHDFDSENYYETVDSVDDTGKVTISCHADGGRKPDGVFARWTFDPATGVIIRQPLH